MIISCVSPANQTSVSTTGSHTLSRGVVHFPKHQTHLWHQVKMRRFLSITRALEVKSVQQKDPEPNYRFWKLVNHVLQYFRASMLQTYNWLLTTHYIHIKTPNLISDCKWNALCHSIEARRVWALTLFRHTLHFIFYRFLESCPPFREMRNVCLVMHIVPRTLVVLLCNKNQEPSQSEVFLNDLLNSFFSDWGTLHQHILVFCKVPQVLFLCIDRA